MNSSLRGKRLEITLEGAGVCRVLNKYTLSDKGAAVGRMLLALEEADSNPELLMQKTQLPEDLLRPLLGLGIWCGLWDRVPPPQEVLEAVDLKVAAREASNPGPGLYTIPRR